MDRGASGAVSLQGCRRGVGQQNCTNDLGVARQRRNLSDTHGYGQGKGFNQLSGARALGGTQGARMLMNLQGQHPDTIQTA
jgi:hypothetical protein